MTLSRRLCRKTMEHHGQPTTLSMSNETDLVRYISVLSMWGFPDCISSDHSQYFCLGTRPNGFPGHRKTHLHDSSKTFDHPENTKKQKDEWDKLPDISDNEDPSLKPRKVYKDPKRLQAAVPWAMKSSLMHCLTNLLSFPLSTIYKLEVRAYIDAVHNPPLTTEVDGRWLQQLTATMLLTAVIASPCSAAEFPYVNNLLIQHAHSSDDDTHLAFTMACGFTPRGKKDTHLAQQLSSAVLNIRR
uniref:Uncharacterized protein n=1 Tax=Romanomermis culicivorax TaxID=13658 RepID=A0A915IHL1_ROMCU